MIDNPFLIRGNARDGSGGAGESAGLFLGTVSDADEDGVQILFDGDEDATDKRYKQLSTGTQLHAGDRVVCAKISGSYVILGRIAYEQTGGGGEVDDALSTTSENPVQNKVITNALAGKVGRAEETAKSTTISDIAAANTGVTISEAQYAQWGKVAMVRIVMSRTSALSGSGATFAYLVPGKRPAINGSATTTVSNHETNAYIDPNGGIYIHGTMAANTSIAVLGTYVLA